MTEYGLPFDGLITGDASVAPYSSDVWAHMWALSKGVADAFPKYGIFKGSGNGTYEPLAVLATSPASANVEIEPGAALVNGRFYENTIATQLAINANASGNPRIDTVILRLDFTLLTIRLAVLQGTPAGSPVAPTLTQNTSFWEIPLADVAVANGFSSLAQTTITPRQRDVLTSARGWMPYAFPLSFVVNGNYNAGSSISAFGVNFGCVAIPFVLSGNLLLAQVDFWQIAVGVGTYNWGWDVYAQDTNEGLTAENTLRRVAYSDSATGNNPGAASMYSCPAVGNNAVALPPGAYWLVIQRRGGSLGFSMGAIAAAGQFLQNTCKSKNIGAANGNTLDMVAATWNAQTNIPAVMLRGRVFGQSSLY